MRPGRLSLLLLGLVASGVAAEPPRPDVRVTGVVTRGGRPLANARVEARILPSPDPRRALSAVTLDHQLAAHDVTAPATSAVVTGDDGRFALSVPEGWGYEVRAIAHDGTYAVPKVVDDDEEWGRPIELVVPAKGLSLRGRAVLRDGAPWRGRVVVSLATRGMYMESLPWGDVALPVDAHGSFSSDHLPSETVEVSVVDPGVLRRFVADVSCPAPEGFTIVVDEGLAPRSVRVEDATSGAPIAGARVTGFGSAAGDWVLAGGVTDRDGTVRLALPSAAHATATADGYGAHPGEKLPPDGPLVLHLARERTVSGRILRDGDGSPLGGLVVEATPFRRTMPEGPRPTLKAVADAGGVFELRGVPPIEIVVVARGPGWISRNLLGEDEDGGDGQAAAVGDVSVVLRAVRTGEIRGVVRGLDGLPVADASVRLLVGHVGRGMGTPHWLSDAHASTPRAVTADGSFVFSQCLPGHAYSLVASAPGRPSTTVKMPGPNVAGPTSVDVVLGDPRRLTVTVEDAESGGPVAGAAFQVRVGANDRAAYDGVTGSTGVAHVEGLPAGALEVEVKDAEDHLVPRERFAVPGSAQSPGDAAVTVSLRRGLTIEGVVRRPDGSPASTASVAARPTGDEGLPHRRDSEYGDVDRAGAFRIRGLAEGPYVVEATAYDGDRTLTGTWRGDAGARGVVVQLAAEPTAAQVPGFTVRLSGHDGKPVPEATVESDLLASSTGYVKDGVFAWKPELLQERRPAWLEFHGARRADGTSLPYGPLRVSPFPAEGASFEYALPAGRPIAGRVVDEEGRGVAGVRLDAWMPGRDDAPFARGSHDKTTSGADGSFRLLSLGDADYDVWVDPPPSHAPPAIPTIHGGSTDVSIVVRRARTIALAVLDPAGRPVPAASARAAFEADFWAGQVQGTTDAQGRVTLSDLDPQRSYALHVEPPRDSPLRGLVRRDWKPADGEVRLESPQRVCGVVKDRDGRPVPAARVQWQQEDGRGEVRCDEHGAFCEPDLRSGAVTLRADASSDAERPESELLSDPVVAKAGDTAVDVTVDRGVDLVVHLEDAEPGAWRGVKAKLIRWMEKEGWWASGHVHSVPLSGAPTFTVRGVVPKARYALFVPAGTHGRIGWVPLGRVPTDGTPLSVKTVAGGTLSGRLRAPSGVDVDDSPVELHGAGWSIAGHSDADGGFTVRGIPDDVFALHARSWSKGRMYVARIEGLRAREGLEVDLAPEPR